MVNPKIEQREREGIRILDIFGPLVFGDSEALLRTTVLRLVNDAQTKIILNLAEVTSHQVCSRTGVTGAPETTSHTRAEWFALPVTTRPPSGLNIALSITA